MSLNKCMIIGNLGRDPEMRYTPSGQAVTQFTVATNRHCRDPQGEWQEETEWFRVVVWARAGRACRRAAAQGPQGLRRGPHPDPPVGGPERQQALHDGAHRRPRHVARAARARGRPAAAG